jgi:hypothetical protein
MNYKTLRREKGKQPLKPYFPRICNMRNFLSYEIRWRTKI